LIAIFDFNEPGGPSTVLFNNTTTISLYDATAINPAALPRIGSNGIGVVYTKPFGIGRLSYNRFVLNLDRPAFGFSLSALGQTGYYEYTFTFAKGFVVDNNFSYGLLLKGYVVKIKDYGDDFIPGFNLGMLYKQNIYRLAVVLTDLNNPKTRAGDLIPMALRVGVTFAPVTNFSLSSNFLRSAESERFFGGVEFQLLPIFILRIGVATNPYLVAGGFGISLRNLSLDYSYRYHPSLKETHILSLSLKS